MVVHSSYLACDTLIRNPAPSFGPILSLGAAVRGTIHFFSGVQDVLEDSVR
jgi:hypothetical protein